MSSRVTASDDSAGADSEIREAAVYALNGWSPFKEPLLEGHWALQNVFVRDGSGADTWYSLEDRPGKLTMMVQDALKSFSPKHENVSCYSTPSPRVHGLGFRDRCQSRFRPDWRFYGWSHRRDGGERITCALRHGHGGRQAIGRSP